MNIKDIEEIVEHVAEVCDEVEFLRGVPVKLPAQNKALLRGRVREALTTLTQHHEAEVERRVEAERERIIQMIAIHRGSLRTGDEDANLVLHGLQKALTSTKTDKQTDITSDK